MDTLILEFPNYGKPTYARRIKEDIIIHYNEENIIVAINVLNASKKMPDIIEKYVKILTNKEYKITPFKSIE